MIKCGYRPIREHMTMHLAVSGYSWEGLCVFPVVRNVGAGGLGIRK